MKCKHCGNDELFYTKGRAVGPISTFYNADKTFNMDGENEGMYDAVTVIEGKWFYCIECDKRTERVSNEIDDIINQF